MGPSTFVEFINVLNILVDRQQSTNNLLVPWNILSIIGGRRASYTAPPMEVVLLPKNPLPV